VSYTLTFEHPDFPDETEFGIQDLGRVLNHGTLEVDEDAERRFVSARRISLEDAFGDNPMISLSGSSTLTDDEISDLTAPTEAELAEQEAAAEQPMTQQTTTTTATERDQSSGTLTAEQLQEQLGGDDGA
jgi:hypothetical protein